MTGPSTSPIVACAARAVAPTIQLVALYVVFHGHYSPGGGFQGGVLLAASFVLVRLGLGSRAAQLQFPTKAGMYLGVAGLAAFTAVGIGAVLGGGSFLDHGALPVPWLATADLRSLAILVVEAAIAVAVPAVLLVIYDTLAEEPANG